MNRFLIGLAIVAALSSASLAAVPQYWDSDANPSGNTLSGTNLGGSGNWGVAPNWWDGSSGSDAVWTDGNDAIFTGTAATVTLTTAHSANSVTFKTNNYNVTASPLSTALTLTGSANITVDSGVTATLGPKLSGTVGFNVLGGGTVILNNGANSNITGAVNVSASSTLSLASGGAIGGTGVNSGNITLDNGTLRNTNDANAASFTFLTINRGIVVGGGGGTVSTPNLIGIYQGTITGTGVLTKTGSGEFRYEGANTANSTFSKLVVNQGLYRIGAGIAGSTEVGFGAVPGSVTADAITLNGGSIGASLPLTLAATRGVTIGASGGTFNGNGGNITVPGPLSGAGMLILTSTSGTSGVTLSNSGNTGTFSGKVVVNSGTMTLSESLTTPNFSGAGGTVSVANGKSFTVGSDNADSSVTTVVSGTGGNFTKNGSGTTSISASWTNTGTTTINNGKLKFATSSGGLGNGTIQINSPGVFDMNSINDSMGQLSGDGAINNNSGTTGLTLVGGADTTYGGQIDGTAKLIVNKSAGTQTLTGANTYTGGTTLSAGVLRINNASGSGTGSGGVTVSGGTLGGTGSISGSVTMNAGTLSPGASVESLKVGSLTLNTGSSMLHEIDTSVGLSVGSDRLNIVAGGLNISTGVSLTMNDLADLTMSGVVLAPDTKLTVIAYNGTWNGTTFTNIANNSPVTIGVNTFTFRYDDSMAGQNYTDADTYTGFVTLTTPAAVPEAPAWLFGSVVTLGGAFANVVRRRIRRG